MAVPGSANSLGRRRRQSREYLMTTHKVGYLIGSLAKGSINRKLAKALVRLAPSELQMTEISFKDLPLYSYDYDSDFPPAARAFKDAIARSEEHTSELQSLMRISYAVFCLKKKKH